MNLEFDFDDIRATEFGVGRDDTSTRSFFFVPADDEVQKALCEMARTSWHEMKTESAHPPKYEPSEKYASIEYIHLPLTDDLARSMRTLHEANNLPIDSKALHHPEGVFCYFARIIDGNGRRLTALRRAAQFKGVLKSRLLRFKTDALKIVPENVFRLDVDFDLLIDAKHVHILRPSGFEFAGQMQAAIKAAVSTNIGALRSELTFVDFDSIEAYAKQHARAARYLASIRSHEEIQKIDQTLLVKHCASTGVEVREVDGKLSVSEKHVLGFLEVLDRRRFEIELVVDAPEQYRAPSRSKLSSAGLR